MRKFEISFLRRSGQILLIAIAFPAFAQNSVSISPKSKSSTSVISAKAKTSKPSFAPIVAAGTAVSTGLNPDEKPSRSADLSLLLGVKHIPSSSKAWLKVSYTREVDYERDDGLEGDTNDAEYSISQTLGIFGYGVGGSLPMSREAKRRTFLGSIGPRVFVNKKFGRFTLGQTLSYTYSGYEYDIRADGRTNSPETIGTASKITFDITDDFSFTYQGAYSYSRSFQKVGRSSFTSTFDFDYVFNDHIGLNIGFGNVRKSTLMADGQTEKLTIYDRTDAQGWMDLSVSL